MVNMKTTIWRPDTCGCKLEYEWDADEPEETRTHKFKTLHVKCNAHKNIADSDVYDVVRDENTRKNKVYKYAKVLLTSLEPQEILEKYIWSFDSSRVLHVSFIGTTTAQKNQIRSICNSELGVGKVVVE